MTTEEIKSSYLKLVQDLLRSQPDLLASFSQRFQAGNYRLAHLVILDAIQALGLKLSQEQEKIYDDFYWVYVN